MMDMAKFFRVVLSAESHNQEYGIMPRSVRIDRDRY